MRPAALLAHLTLWASSTQAFHIYDPEWRRDLLTVKSTQLHGQAKRNQNGARFNIKQRTVESTKPVSERAAEQAARLTTKYAGRRLADAPAAGTVVKRDNKYDIMEAKEPSGKYTAGVDQDGTDYSYFVEVEIGDKKKTMYMLIDTGAGSSWVMGSGCKSEACGLHNLFGSADSSTLDLTSDPFSIAYGSGKVSGKLANDTFKVAGMSFKYQFGVADTTSAQFVSFAFDGILGLSLNTGANQNFLEAVSSSHDLGQNIFSIALNRAADGTNNGEIMFGSTNKDKYEGSIGYTSLVEGNDWSIELGDMGYDGKKAKIGGIPSYIDTGTSFMFGPADSVKALHALIPGATSSDNATWTVPCDSDKNLSVTFSDVEYRISPKDWISPKSKSGTCTSNIYGHEVVQGAWLLGDAFLKNVYAVFDKDKRRIGFAKSVINSDVSDGTEGTKTASENAGSTRVSAASDATGTNSVDTGLGKESVSTNTATAGSSTSTSDSKDSSAPGLPLSQAYYTFAFCIITFFAALA